MARPLVCVLLLAATACAPPLASDPLDVAPSDFSLDVTVLTAEPHVLAHLRTSRFVVFPDGSLHHGDDPDWGPNTLPPLTRKLDRRQVANVWSYLVRMGMGSADRADPVVNFQLLRKPDAGSAYMVAITGRGDYWNFVRYIGAADEPDPAFVELIRLLAELAWATDRPDAEAVPAPRRYDLGPDPYARYRDGRAE